MLTNKKFIIVSQQGIKTTFLSPIVYSGDQPIQARIVANGFGILADVAITDEDKGLSINDMRFPIDIICLNGTGSVFHIEENLRPCVQSLEYPFFSPKENAQCVPETVAGFAQKYHLKIGTDVDFSIVLPDKSSVDS